MKMDDDDDDYVLYGTPLPDIDDATSLRKSNKQLQVRDDQGRQRFHGAFTGGFSAGYFNTVGSKEGWTPASFVSSRTKGSEKTVQRPEDFMDSEDFNAFGIAPRKIHATANFQDASDPLLKRKVSSYSDSVIPGEAPLKGLIQPTSDSIGIRILMKMGWKPGQGIGPRVKKKKKIGVSDRNSILNEPDFEEEDPNLLMFTFAPKDSSVVPYSSKDDYHGIGYVGLSTKSVLSVSSNNPSSVTTKSWLDKSKKKITITGKAFGIGALEDDDDDDVYGQDDMTQYDFSDMGMDQEEKSKSQTGTSKNYESPGKVLMGFILSSRISSTRKQYPLPQLPPNFRPLHKQALSGKPIPERSQRSRKLNAEERSLLLGEKKFVSLDVPKITATESVEAPSIKTKAANIFPRLTSSNFKPFSKDLEKQDRYDDYLKNIQVEGKGKIAQPATMTEWEKQQELEEFARAAFLYQPMSSALSSRFVSGSHLEVGNPNQNLLGIKKEEKEHEGAEKSSKDCISRKTCEWHPASLLCRRFNVPNPFPNSSSVGTLSPEKKSTSLFDNLLFAAEPLSPTRDSISEISTPEVVIKIESPEKLPKKNIPSESEAAASTSENGQSKEEKPPMDLFKAIFQNSSSEDESSASDHEEESQNHTNYKAENPVTETTGTPSHQLDSLNSEIPALTRQTPKATYGVFANLDLDTLNVKKKPTVELCKIPSLDGAINEVNFDVNDNIAHLNRVKELEQPLKSASLPEEQLYGPRLPPPGSQFSIPQPTSKSSKSSQSKHSKHKLKHKHHKHSKKKSKKHKRKHSHRSDHQSSGSSDVEEIESSLIIQKLKDIQSKSKKFKHC